MFKAYNKEQNNTFVGETTPKHDGKTLSVIVSSGTDTAPLQTADRIDICGSDERVTASYKIVGWKAIEHLWDGIRITWQTYAPDEIDTMQEKMDEMEQALAKASSVIEQYEAKVQVLTSALLDLASVVGKTETPTYGEEEPEEAVEPETEPEPVVEDKPKRTRRKKVVEGND